MSDLAGKLPRILIIDDEEEWRRDIKYYTKLLKYDSEVANSFEEVEVKIKRAEEDKSPFSVATIDMKFEVGKERTFGLQGKKILRYIKSEHPYIVCIMISSSSVVAHEILDLRDDYELDYYISKDKLDLDALDRAITRAIKRVSTRAMEWIRPFENIHKHRDMLKEELERYKDICIIYSNNLALMELKKAQKGVAAGVDIENEISIYNEKLEEFTEKVREIEKKIRQLKAD